MKSLYSAVTSMFLFVMSTVTYATPVFLTDTSGQLTGIQNLEVRASTGPVNWQDRTLIGFFDVMLLDTTCISAYSGCDDIVNDLLYPDGGNESLYRVLDTSYTESPENILGCESTSACNIITVNNIHTNDTLSGKWIFIQPGNDIPTFSGNLAGIGGIGQLMRSDDLATDAQRVYAAWSPSVSAVPVPAAFWLLGSGLVGLVGFRRRK